VQAFISLSIVVRVMRGLGLAVSHPAAYPATLLLSCVADRGNRKRLQRERVNKSKSTAMERAAESTWAAE